MMTEPAKTNPYTDKPKPLHPALAALARKSGAVDAASQSIRCARAACASVLDAGEGRSEAGRVAYAEAHGYVKVGSVFFCSKRCKALETVMSSGTLSPADVAELRPATPTKSDPQLKAIVLSELADVDGSGVSHRVGCAYPSCKTSLEVPKAESMRESAVRVAKAHGFVESASGVYCGGTCARKHAADLAHHIVRDTDVPNENAARRERAAMFATYRQRVFAAGADLNQEIDLVLSAGSKNVVALSSHGRVAAFEADTIAEACEYALGKVPDFCAGAVGAPASPFAAVIPVRVGANRA